MIGRLRGTLAERAAGKVIVDCGGVGYVVAVSAHTALALPVVGGMVFAFITVFVVPVSYAGFLERKLDRERANNSMKTVAADEETEPADSRAAIASETDPAGIEEFPNTD